LILVIFMGSAHESVKGPLRDDLSPGDRLAALTIGSGGLSKIN
jgi:hypothetical protein